MWGPYWKHILDGWRHRNDENVLFMFYEDSQLDMEKALRKLSNFLGKPLKDEDLPKLMDHLHIENVRKNPTINFKFNDAPTSAVDFVRQGKVGGNPEMTDEVARKIDEWTKKNLGDFDFKFPSV